MSTTANTPAAKTSPVATLGRKGPWHITVTTLDGHRYHYNADTERDADLFAIAILAHGRDIADTDVSYDPSRAL